MIKIKFSSSPIDLYSRSNALSSLPSSQELSRVQTRDMVVIAVEQRVQTRVTSMSTKMILPRCTETPQTSESYMRGRIIVIVQPSIAPYPVTLHLHMYAGTNSSCCICQPDRSLGSNSQYNLTRSIIITGVHVNKSATQAYHISVKKS